MLFYLKKTHLLWKGKKPKILYSVQFLSTRQHSAFCKSVSSGVNWQVVGMKAGSRVPLAVCRLWPAGRCCGSSAPIAASRDSRGDSGAACGPALAGKLVFCFPHSVLPLVLLPQAVLLRATPWGISRHGLFCRRGQEALTKGMNRLCLAWFMLPPLLGVPGEVPEGQLEMLITSQQMCRGFIIYVMSSSHCCSLSWGANVPCPGQGQVAQATAGISLGCVKAPQGSQNWQEGWSPEHGFEKENKDCRGRVLWDFFGKSSGS